MRIIFFIAIYFSVLFPAIGQQKRNLISLEIGKSTLLGGLSYDHQFKKQTSGLRVFAGFNLSNYRSAFTTGVGAYYLVGARPSFLELGTDMGFLYTSTLKNSDNKPLINNPDFGTKTFICSLNIGYRHSGTRFVFRVGVAPFIIKEGIYPGAYLSVGSLLL